MEAATSLLPAGGLPQGHSHEVLDALFGTLLLPMNPEPLTDTEYSDDDSLPGLDDDLSESDDEPPPQ